MGNTNSEDTTARSDDRNDTLKGTGSGLNVLTGTSETSPALVGDAIFGKLVAWADAGNANRITIAISQSSTPYDPMVLNQEWSSPYAPAVVFAFDDERVFVAWTDDQGQVWLADSGDGWQSATAINGATSSSGPALAFLSDTIFLAWKDQNSQLALFTRDESGTENVYRSGRQINSRPTLATDGDRLIALSGGAEDGSGDQTLLMFNSMDLGQNFWPFTIQQIECVGPPALSSNRIDLYLVWADGKTRQLCSVVTNDLESFSFTTHDYICQSGGPSLALMFNPETGLDEPFVALTLDDTPPDANNQHVAVLSLPPISGVSDKPSLLAENYARRASPPRAPNPCPPLSIWDPAKRVCVPSGSCWGRCITQSFNLAFGWPVFNPFKYAFCVIGCKNS
jgi:hypothetical protein